MSKLWSQMLEEYYAQIEERAMSGTGESPSSPGVQGTGITNVDYKPAPLAVKTSSQFYSGVGTEGVEADPPHSRVVQFGDLDITVLLTAEDKFLGIAQVQARRSFLSPMQELSRATYQDFDDLYRE